MFEFMTIRELYELVMSGEELEKREFRVCRIRWLGTYK